MINNVFDLLEKYNLKAFCNKCTFMLSATYLGFYLDGQVVKPDPDKVKPILDFESPTNIKQMQRFLGMANYDRGFVQKFAIIAQPMYKLLRKGEKFLWGKEQNESFEKIKELIKYPILLKHADFEKPFTLEVDACGHGVAAILEQDGHIIALASRLLKNNELRWPVGEKELYSIVFTCTKFRFFIDTKNDTILKTDNLSLSYLKTMKISAKISRWVMFLMEFNLNVFYVQGSQNKDADLLSRLNDKLEDVCAAFTRGQKRKAEIKEAIDYKAESGSIESDADNYSIENTSFENQTNDAELTVDEIKSMHEEM
eukprot:NODE_1062_length_2379_cov_0.228947.p1 type:complete len:312 gc:universal NODE_1062_length_2379_cov_0.228947:231-1166(+)